MDNNTQIEDNVKLGTAAKIESYCHLGLIPEKYRGANKTLIGSYALIRSHTVIYIGNIIGDNFSTGHAVLLREENKIGNNVSIGSHTIIEHHVVIGNNVRIQGNTFIPEFSVIEEDAWIGPMVTFTNARYPASLNTKKWLKGPVVRKEAKIGAAVVILPGVTIGEFSFVGAGSVVTKDVPSGSVVAGNPAKVINKITSLNFPDGTPVYPIK